MATHPRTRRAGAPQRARRRGVQTPRPDLAGPAADPVVEPPLRPVEPEPTGGGWREAVVSLSGLNVLAGIWLIIAPWVLNYSAGDPKWNDVVFGAIVAILALVRVGGAFRATELSIVNALIGVWLFISAFTIDQSWTAGWNNIILGVIVFVLAIASADASALRRREAPPAV